jgi:hypothetical protein
LDKLQLAAVDPQDEEQGEDDDEPDRFLGHEPSQKSPPLARERPGMTSQILFLIINTGWGAGENFLSRQGHFSENILMGSA